MALVERGDHGHLHARVVDRLSAKNLKTAIRERVHHSAEIMTDDSPAYHGIGHSFAGGHQTVTHSKREYVRGAVHINTAESFFALLKRGVHGTFHHVSKQHLHRYCDEFGFRWDHRKATDGERTVAAIRLAAGKRLLYRQ